MTDGSACFHAAPASNQSPRLMHSTANILSPEVIVSTSPFVDIIASSSPRTEDDRDADQQVGGHQQTLTLNRRVLAAVKATP